MENILVGTKSVISEPVQDWLVWYDQLRMYRARYGHLDLDRNVVPDLVRWVRTQLDLARRGLMFPWQRKMLENLYNGGPSQPVVVIEVQQQRNDADNGVFSPYHQHHQQPHTFGRDQSATTTTIQTIHHQLQPSQQQQHQIPTPTMTRTTGALMWMDYPICTSNCFDHYPGKRIVRSWMKDSLEEYQNLTFFSKMPNGTILGQKNQISEDIVNRLRNGYAGRFQKRIHENGPWYILSQAEATRFVMEYLWYLSLRTPHPLDSHPVTEQQLLPNVSTTLTNGASLVINNVLQPERQAPFGQNRHYLEHVDVTTAAAGAAPSRSTNIGLPRQICNRADGCAAWRAASSVGVSPGMVHGLPASSVGVLPLMEATTTTGKEASSVERAKTTITTHGLSPHAANDSHSYAAAATNRHCTSLLGDDDDISCVSDDIEKDDNSAFVVGDAAATEMRGDSSNIMGLQHGCNNDGSISDEDASCRELKSPTLEFMNYLESMIDDAALKDEKAGGNVYSEIVMRPLEVVCDDEDNDDEHGRRRHDDRGITFASCVAAAAAMSEERHLSLNANHHKGRKTTPQAVVGDSAAGCRVFDEVTFGTRKESLFDKEEEEEAGVSKHAAKKHAIVDQAGDTANSHKSANASVHSPLDNVENRDCEIRKETRTEAATNSTLASYCDENRKGGQFGADVASDSCGDASSNISADASVHSSGVDIEGGDDTENRNERRSDASPTSSSRALASSSSSGAVVNFRERRGCESRKETPGATMAANSSVNSRRISADASAQSSGVVVINDESGDAERRNDGASRKRGSSPSNGTMDDGIANSPVRWKGSPSTGGGKIVPHENDVLMVGRGGRNNQHVGNEKLRALARGQVENYRMSSKKGKSYISRELVKEVRNMSPPGRFLKQQLNGRWIDVGNEVAREKASQALQDAVAVCATSSTDATEKQLDKSMETLAMEHRRSSSAPPPIHKGQRPDWEDADTDQEQQHVTPRNGHVHPPDARGIPIDASVHASVVDVESGDTEDRDESRAASSGVNVEISRDDGESRKESPPPSDVAISDGTANSSGASRSSISADPSVHSSAMECSDTESRNESRADRKRKPPPPPTLDGYTTRFASPSGIKFPSSLRPSGTSAGISSVNSIKAISTKEVSVSQRTTFRAFVTSKLSAMREATELYNDFL